MATTSFLTPILAEDTDSMRGFKNAVHNGQPMLAMTYAAKVVGELQDEIKAHKGLIEALAEELLSLKTPAKSADPIGRRKKEEEAPAEQ